MAGLAVAATAAATAVFGGSGSSKASDAREGIARSSGEAGCVPRAGKIVLARGQVAVYRNPAGDTRICNGQRNDITIATAGDDIFPPPVLRIRGNLVAFVSLLDEPDMEALLVNIVDLADPNPETMVSYTDAGGYIKIASLRLTADGAIAWIACQSSRFPPQLRNGRGTDCYRSGRSASLYKASRVGGDLRTQLLDRGRRITPSSLRLDGRTLSWRNAGRRRTARL
ncbi:MAG: hypothetical protein WKF96_20490 [Solirubrobacteraceae bacterium]